MSSFYNGLALNGVDAKNRVSVPADFRAAAQNRSGAAAVFLAPHATLPCVIGYDESYLATFAERIEQKYPDSFDEARDDLIRDFYSASEKASPDENGRIVLIAAFKDHARINRQALFLGALDKFELWDPAVFLELKGGSTAARRVQALLKGRTA
ncbi:MAG: hypothetical protein RQ833_07565 [Sphingomonadaceae bacterium]|nr:hypothetical protein [Sphingomonadaceae bacterium]